jgi:hypothetical protein
MSGFGPSRLDWHTGVEVTQLTSGDDPKMKIHYYCDTDQTSRRTLYRINNGDDTCQVRRVNLETGEEDFVCDGVRDAPGLGLGPDHFYGQRILGEDKIEILRYNFTTLEETKREFEGIPVEQIPWLGWCCANPALYMTTLVEDPQDPQHWYNLILNVETGERKQLPPGQLLDTYRSPERTDGREEEAPWPYPDKRHPGEKAAQDWEGNRIQGYPPMNEPFTWKTGGHFAYVGLTQGMIAAAYQEPWHAMKMLGNLMIAWPGDRGARVVAPGYVWIHVDTSRCGRYFVVDELEEARIFLGSIRTGKVRQLLATSASLGYGNQYGHPHASFTPDNQFIVFNSDRTGIPHVYAAKIPESFLEELEAE